MIVRLLGMQHPCAPQDIVGYNEPTGADFRQAALPIFDVVLLVGVDEHDIDRPFDRLEGLERPADLRGVRPWVWRDSYTMKAFIEAAGANGVVLGVPEVYPGLQTNMIDTVISSSIGVLGFQWHAALKTMSKPASGVVVGAFIIKKDRLEALPEAAQRYIRDTANDTEAKFMRIGRKLDDDASRALAKRLEVVDMAPFRGAWEATARRARDSLVGRLYSKQLLERVQAIVEAP